MSTNEEKIVWRMVAMVDGDIISKDHKKAEKAIKQARNAVVKRLCINAKIDYPYAWWQGPEAADKVEFVDKFLGTLISVISNSKVRPHDHELEFIRYRVPQIVTIFGPKPTEMTADDIDSQGNWHFGEGDHEKVSLLGSRLPVPSDVRSTDQPEKQEVMAMADAQLSLDNCPGCNAEIPFGSIILITEFAHLFPANCCDKMIWFDKISEAEFKGLE
ncbi:MAG: hypothetical protein ACKVIR_05580 [Candidatus Poseidoniales archaeon]